MKLFSACRNLVILTALLWLPYLLLPYLHVPARLSARIGIALLFLITALAHFLRAPALSSRREDRYRSYRSYKPYRTYSYLLSGRPAQLNGFLS